MKKGSTSEFAQRATASPLGRAGSWPEIIADLDSVTDGKRFVARSAPRPAASLALRATGVALRQPSGQLARPPHTDRPIPKSSAKPLSRWQFVLPINCKLNC
jgi:hypothetical protein